MKTRLIGDVHGKYARYKNIIKGCTNSVQVGDLGLGFRQVAGWKAGEFTQNPPHSVMKEDGHRFIRGNHDNPGECKKNSQWIKDGTVEGNVMFIGGAVSIDKAFRVKDYTWWEDEELSDLELDALVQRYLIVKPKVMVTHECPEDVALGIVQSHIIPGAVKLDFPSRTRKAFQRMWSAHQPDLWVFGHWHLTLNMKLKGTEFICLNELEYVDIDFEKYSNISNGYSQPNQK